MTRFTTLALALAVLALSSAAARAEVITFKGKTSSQILYEIGTPHSSVADLKAFAAQEKALADKGDEKAAAMLSRPYQGQLKVDRVLVQIGQQVVDQQPLLEYSLPVEILIAERQKLSNDTVLSLHSQIQSISADIDLQQIKLTEIRKRLEIGYATQQEFSDQLRLIDLLRLRLKALEEYLKIEKETSKVILDVAKAKYGPQTEMGRALAGKTNVLSPCAGHILWINPDVQPGVILSKPTLLFRVGTIDPLIIRAKVHESIIPRLKEGDKATVTFESLPGQTFQTVISFIALTADTSDVQFPSHFEVQLTLPNPGAKLKVGLRGDVSVSVPDGER